MYLGIKKIPVCGLGEAREIKDEKYWLESTGLQVVCLELLALHFVYAYMSLSSHKLGKYLKYSSLLESMKFLWFIVAEHLVHLDKD